MPKHVDEIFQSALENHHEVADASVWERLGQTLSSKEGKVVLPWFYNPRKALFVALFISMLSFGGGYIYALINDGEPTLANNKLSKAQITTTLPSNSKVDQGQSGFNAVGGRKSNSTTPISPNQIGEDAVSAEKVDEVYPSSNPSHDNLVLLHNTEEEDQSSAGLESSEHHSDRVADVIAFLPAVRNDRVSFTEGETETQESESALLLEHAISASIEQTETQSSESHLISIETPIAYGKLASRFLEFSVGNAMLKSSYTIGDDIDARYRADYKQESNLNYELRFGKYFTPNVGVFTGFRVDRFGFSQNIEQMFVKKIKPNSATEEMYGVLAKSSYEYNFTSYEIPVGVRFKGLHHRLGYHADLGFSYTKGSKQSFSKSLNIEEFDFLNSEISNSKYDESGAAVAFSRIGLDYFLFANGGLSFDAVLRKRVTATTNSDGGQAGSLGFQVGLFCNF